MKNKIDNNIIKNFWSFLKNNKLEKKFITIIVLLFLFIMFRDVYKGIDTIPRFIEDKVFEISTTPANSNIDDIRLFINFQEYKGHLNATITRRNLSHLNSLSFSIPQSNITSIRLYKENKELLDNKYFEHFNDNHSIILLKKLDFDRLSININFDTKIEPHGFFEINSGDGINKNHVEQRKIGSPIPWLSEFILGDYECTINCFTPMNQNLTHILLNNSIITITEYRQDRERLNDRFYLNTFNREKADDKEVYIIVYTGLLSTLIFEFLIFLIELISKLKNKRLHK